VDRALDRDGQPFLRLVVDADFGPLFPKFCSYFPYNARLCLNGHEWAKRQAAQAGIGFTALDNGFATVDEPGAVQAICDRLGPEQIIAGLRLGDHRAHALLQALLVFRLLLNGLRNRHDVARR
jgi:hypothetical protein